MTGHSFSGFLYESCCRVLTAEAKGKTKGKRERYHDTREECLKVGRGNTKLRERDDNNRRPK